MKLPPSGPKLRKLLDTCAALQQIRSKISDPDLASEARSKLRRQSKRKTAQLARDLESHHFRGPLAAVMESYPLAPDHFQILSVLLQHQTRSEDPACEGRLILAAIFETAYEVLAQVGLLHPEGPLRASGLVVPADDECHPDDVLDTRFVLSETAIESFRQEIAGGDGPLPVGGARSPRTEPHGAYAGNRELLIDLRLLHNLYRQRAERVFHEDRWNRLHDTGHQPGRPVSERIQAGWMRLRRRLDQTPDAATFPAVRLMREYQLCEEELVMIVHLLFKELFEGNAYADVADLLRLVSSSEQDLIHNRRLVADQAALRKAEILCIEPMLENRALTGEAYLADWVIHYLFGAAAPGSEIRLDERIDWHQYLAGIDDTRKFFQDLDG